MKIAVVKDERALSTQAVEVVAGLLETKPDAVLGLPTGSTPMGMYAELVRRVSRGELDLSRVTIFNLDEYVGLPPGHPASYKAYMRQHLLAGVSVAAAHVPDGNAPDLEMECRAYDERIRQVNGIDLQILGIGANGHIGFNEPGTPFGSETHVLELAASTREANSRFFASPGEVPRRAISVGIKTIMQARRILLLAGGADKAGALREAVLGPVTESLPASVLQLHPNATVVADQEAAGLLTEVSTVGEQAVRDSRD